MNRLSDAVRWAFGVFRSTVNTVFNVVQHVLGKTGIKRPRIEVEDEDEGQRRKKFKLDTEASEENKNLDNKEEDSKIVHHVGQRSIRAKRLRCSENQPEPESNLVLLTPHLTTKSTLTDSNDFNETKFPTRYEDEPLTDASVSNEAVCSNNQVPNEAFIEGEDQNCLNDNEDEQSNDNIVNVKETYLSTQIRLNEEEEQCKSEIINEDEET